MPSLKRFHGFPPVVKGIVIFLTILSTKPAVRTVKSDPIWIQQAARTRSPSPRGAVGFSSSTTSIPEASAGCTNSDKQLARKGASTRRRRNSYKLPILLFE